jgi:hypothetical protein
MHPITDGFARSGRPRTALPAARRLGGTVLVRRRRGHICEGYDAGLTVSSFIDRADRAHAIS